MYINPNTDIFICRNVPVDPDHTNTLWFPNASSQLTYFTGKVKRSFDKNTYQRVSRGVARIGCPADDLYDCNYMFFQNTSYGNKIFYAFVIRVDYVNDDVCDVVYTMDPVQTYLFDMVLEECYIERQTAESDNFGEHLEVETVDFGPIVYSGVTHDTHTDMPAVLVATSFIRGGS